MKIKQQNILAFVLGIIFTFAFQFSVYAQTTTINDGDTYKNVYGNNDGNDVTVPYGTPENNTVTVNGGTVDGYVRGGYYWDKDAPVSVTGNTVIVNGGNIRDIDGGTNTHGLTSNNKVIIKGGKIGESSQKGGLIYGGYSYEGTASDNSVQISGGNDLSIIADIRGGGTKGGGQALNNSVLISGNKNTVISNKGGNYNLHIWGGEATGVASYNTVRIEDSTLNKMAIIGGEAYGGAANNNSVYIGGDAKLSGDAFDILDSDVKTFGDYGANIIGGDGENEASNNTVTIYGTPDFTNVNVIGGHSTNGNTNNNTVNIFSPVKLVGLYGGIGADALDGAQTGNTLNIGSKNVTVNGRVKGFQNMNFYLPSDITANDTMLTVTGEDGTKSTDLTGVTFGAAVQSGANIKTGDTVTLITNPNGLDTDDTLKTQTVTTAPAAYSLTLDSSYDLTIEKSGANSVVAKVVKEEVTPNTERAKSLVETRAASTTFINSASDAVSSNGFKQAADAVALETAKMGAGASSAVGFTPFAAAGVSGLRAESGSYVKTRGFGLNVGFAREVKNGNGKLLFGPIVEWGGGKYESHQNDGTRADGKSHYYGIGFMARQTENSGFYYEGSIRGGRVNSDYNANIGALGKVNYDSSSGYWAAHLGVGKIFKLGRKNSLDGYFKYFYSRQGSDGATVHIANGADENAYFDAVNSHRLRIGARFNHKVSEKSNIYGGLAYQYEFGGEARAAFNGVGAPSPSVRGGSGMLEFGVELNPGGKVSLDIGVSGWAGKQRGGTAQVGIMWRW